MAPCMTLSSLRLGEAYDKTDRHLDEALKGRKALVKSVGSNHTVKEYKNNE